MDYRKLLLSLESLFYRFGGCIASEDEEGSKDMMKEVVSIIEHHTNLDLYNLFTDLYK